MRISIGKNLITRLGVLILLLAMYSIGTISAITVSWTFPCTLLIISVVFFAGYSLLRRKLYANSISCAWILVTVVCLFGTIRGGSFIDLFFYIIATLVLFFSSNLESDALYGGIRLFGLFGLFFAIGCLWQYFFPDQYYAHLYPLFGVTYQTSIRRQFTFHGMCTGFTAQTAVAAQFIVLGLMGLVYGYSSIQRRSKRIIQIMEILVLAYGLILTGKRSPILNLFVSFILVDMLTVKRSKRAKRVMSIFLGLVIVGLIIYFIFPFFSNSGSSVARIFDYLNSDDADISNGRFTLYSLALGEFLQHPFIGIGWGEFGALYDTTGTHNIYLQLLCECGIFGFLIVAGVMIFSFFKTIQALKHQANMQDDKSATLLKCSVFIQTYLLIYGFFGNPIYDYNYFLMYIYGLMIAARMIQKDHCVSNYKTI